jgi:hypothetical protein
VRYFKPDEGYDRRFYENDAKNIFVIIGVFAVFYSTHILYFWGLVSLAMFRSQASMWFNVCVFVSTIAMFVLYLIYGRKTNDLREEFEFYSKKILSIRMAREEAARRAEQEAKNKETLAKAKEKLEQYSRNAGIMEEAKTDNSI